MTTQNQNEEYSHPIGWGQTNSKCAAFALAGEESENCQPVLPEGNLDRLSIVGGYCRHHYGKARAEEACAWPDCDRSALDVEGHWGVYCEEHLAELRRASGCSFIGCDRSAVGLVLVDEDGDSSFFAVDREDMTEAEDGWPVCEKHCEGDVNHPPANYDPDAKKRRRRKAHERRSRSRQTQERGNHRTPAPASSSPKRATNGQLSEEEKRDMKSLSLTDLLLLAATNERYRLVLYRALTSRMAAATREGRGKDVAEALDEHLPPPSPIGSANADSSQPAETQTVEVSAGSDDTE